MSGTFRIAKTEPDKMLVFGWGNVAIAKDGTQLQDLQGDVIDPEELEKAAYDHVLNFRNTGERHDPGLRRKGRLVESCVFTKEKQAAIGIPPGTVPEGWWVGYKIDDPAAWEKIKKGEYQMFSIEGKGQRTPIDKGADSIAKSYTEMRKFNPYHGPDGRFASANGATSFTYAPGKSRAHDLAIQRAKEKAGPKGVNVRAIEIDMDGTKVSYRMTEGGIITDMTRSGPRNTNGMTLDDIKARAEKLGYQVKVYNDKELAELDAKREKSREESIRFLNHMDVKDRSNTYRSPRNGYKGH